MNKFVTFFAAIDRYDDWYGSPKTFTIFSRHLDKDIQNILNTFAGEPVWNRWKINSDDFEYISSLLSTVGVEARIEHIPSNDLVSMVVLSCTETNIKGEV